MIKAVVFDLDDTLISEKQYIKSGFKHIARIIGRKYNVSLGSVYGSLLRLFKTSTENVFNRLLDQYEFVYSEDLILYLVNEYRNHNPKLEFYEDVVPCLEYLKTKGIRTGIITDGYVESQKIKLNSVKAYDYFDCIIITDELGEEYWKPHPRAFKMMRSALNITFSEMIYVGDNPKKDFLAGNELGILTIQISRIQCIYNGICESKNHKAALKIKSLVELNKYIEGEHI